MSCCFTKCAEEMVVQQSLACGGKRKQALSNTVILDDGSDINSQAASHTLLTNGKKQSSYDPVAAQCTESKEPNLVDIQVQVACGCSKGNRTDIPAIVDELGADFNNYSSKRTVLDAKREAVVECKRISGLAL
ncbi:hypothetical protein Tco_0222539 [Tanacetum coccineum]